MSFMGKREKKRKVRTNIVLLISICACILVCVILLTKDQKNSNEFEEILEEYHISVTGEDLVLSHVQMRGLLDSVQGKQEEMDIKYRERMGKRGRIVITATEFLELDFYSMSEGEQQAFLAKAKNQTVQVAQNGDAFLITYNPEEEPETQELQKPDKEAVLAAREAALEGMTEEEIERVKNVAIGINLKLEHEFLYGDIEYAMADPNSAMWNYLEQAGEDIIVGYAYRQEIWEQKEELGLSDEEFQAQYGEPVYADNEYDAARLIEIFTELQDSIQNEAFKQDWIILTEYVQKAKDTHDIQYIRDMYHMAHDMDYYLLRYGPEDVGAYIEDKSTVDMYYGVLEDYKGTPYYQE